MFFTERYASLMVAFLLFDIGLAQADERGLSRFSGNPGINGGATCSVCHVPPLVAAKPIVTITGPTLVNAGETNDYLVTVKGGAGNTVGVNISSSGTSSLIGDGLSTVSAALLPIDGDLRLTGLSSGSLQKVSRELSHSKPKAKVANQASFKFQWIAPPYNKTVALFAAGVSTNEQHNLLGDGTGSASLFVRVVNGDTPPSPPPPKPTILLSLEEYVAGLSAPTAISHAKDSRLFIAFKNGAILVAAGKNNLLTEPFLNLSGRTDLATDGEQGLLGLAFHPNYAKNGFFYVYYSRKIDLPNGNVLLRSRISRFSRSNLKLADPMSEVVIMEFAQPFGNNHKAGDIHFGPDGYLYIASGDGAGFAQGFGNLGGKLLRIDVDNIPDVTNGPDCDISGKRNYRIPSGNAFTNGKGQGCDEIYALGLRNPWRFSFDRANGNIWIADVGENTEEEIDFIAAGTSGGINFGWPCYEGNLDRASNFQVTGCNRGYLFPIYAYGHERGPLSVTGGYVYRGKDFPDLRGKYIFASLGFGFPSSIMALSEPLTRPNVVELSLAGLLDFPTTFGEDFRGELYIAGNGGIYKVRGSNLP